MVEKLKEALLATKIVLIKGFDAIDKENYSLVKTAFLNRGFELVEQDRCVMERTECGIKIQIHVPPDGSCVEIALYRDGEKIGDDRIAPVLLQWSEHDFIEVVNKKVLTKYECSI